MRITEENIVQEIKAKNEESIPYILEKYGGLLHSVIRKYLHGNQPDIEECLSDVVVAIWFHIDSFVPEKNDFKQWIAAIAKYRAIDYVRKFKKEKEHQQQLKWSEQIGSQITNANQLEVDSLLKELSTVEQAIFHKYYIEGWPSREIASQYQAKESWVHNKLSRGRKKLKKILLNNEV